MIDLHTLGVNQIVSGVAIGLHRILSCQEWYWGERKVTIRDLGFTFALLGHV